MRYVAFGLIGLLAGAFIGWIIAGMADMLIEPALLLIEITAALGAVLGAKGVRWWRRPPGASPQT
jgi:flagellar motor component MotA